MMHNAFIQYTSYTTGCRRMSDVKVALPVRHLHPIKVPWAQSSLPPPLSPQRYIGQLISVFAHLARMPNTLTLQRIQKNKPMQF